MSKEKEQKEVKQQSAASSSSNTLSPFQLMLLRQTNMRKDNRRK